MNIKRTVLALGAMILGIGFLDTSPAFALANPPAPPVGCQQVVAGNGVWPEGKHSYFCTGATQANGNTCLVC